MTTLEAFSDFSRNYLMARCYSQKTIEGYWWVIKSFIESAGNVDTTEINLEKLSSWVCYMEEVKANKKLTIHTNVSYFRVFVGYLHLKGECQLTKEEIVAPRRPKRRNIKWAPSSRVETMINASGSIRDKAIIAVMFCGAIRNAELRNLKRDDINGLDVRIEHGKGDEDRTVYMTEQAKGLLDRYLASRVDKSPYLFVTNHGNKIASSTLRYIFAHTSELAGVEHTNPHQLRHGAGTELMLNGMHMRYIQEYLGHEYITTTQIYTHVEQPDLKLQHAERLPKFSLT